MRLLANPAGTRSTARMRSTFLVLALLVAKQNSSRQRTIARWPVVPPHRPVGIVETILAACFWRGSRVTCVGFSKKLSMCALWITFRTALRTIAASLAMETLVAMIGRLSGACF